MGKDDNDDTDENNADISMLTEICTVTKSTSTKTMTSGSMDPAVVTGRRKARSGCCLKEGREAGRCNSVDSQRRFELRS